MNFKALIYFLLIAIMGIAGIFFVMNSRGNKKKMPVSGKWSLLIGILLLVITTIGGVDFVRRVYDKMKITVTTLNNFPETVETESSDTTDYVKVLRMYEPAKYKGKVPEQYYTNYGFRDWWRFPLVYPYSVYCKGIPDKGAIVNDSSKTNYEEGYSVSYITPLFDIFIFDENYLAGKIVQDNIKQEISEQYFIFDFRTGRQERVNGKDSFYKKLNEINFNGSRKFIRVSEYSSWF